jgi:tRNA threonylcarbamoyladenosine biosynthesis protein TsaE
VGAVLHLATAGAEETRSLGRAVAPLLERGDVVSLTGDLGAGKTTLVQGVAAGLHVRQPVLSPTFTLVREYEGRERVFHLDVYRLDRIQDVLDLGFQEMLDQDGVVLIEWGDAIETLLPDDHLQIEMTLGPEDDGRLMDLSASGGSWAMRWHRLDESTRRWARVEPGTD